MKKSISNWGNYPVTVADEQEVRFNDDFIALLEDTKSVIARGKGRCYGDASLNQNHVVSTLKYKNILRFDNEHGIITCESGLTLDDLLSFSIPRGWFLPVTPGTKYVTVGGALASDVHGKNHHKEGTFGDHVSSFRLYTALGEWIDVSRDNNPDLFKATAGGMGLTGIITHVTFKLKPIESNRIVQRKVKARNLSEAMQLFENNYNSTYSMAWIDCLQMGKNMGRSLVMLGEHEKQSSKSVLKYEQKQLFRMPFNLPPFVLNQFSVKLFNWLYYHKEFKRDKESIISYDPFFYPLDAISDWNKMYGNPGFLQYQFVLPLESSEEGMTAVLKRIAQQGMGSFLAVLKLFGEENENFLSFPTKGYTLALDFPVKKSLFPFLDELDRIVLDYGGRIYLSKDARMKRDVFERSYSKLNQFVDVVQKYNPGKFESIQSNRLFKDL